MRAPVDVVSWFQDRPWVWKRCAAPDCATPFPTQCDRRVYCSAACRARVGYYHRAGRPFPDRSAAEWVSPRPRACADERCGALFVPVQPNQRFCSRACGTRCRVRAWYRRRKEVRA